MRDYDELLELTEEEAEWAFHLTDDELFYRYVGEREVFDA